MITGATITATQLLAQLIVFHRVPLAIAQILFQAHRSVVAAGAGGAPQSITGGDRGGSTPGLVEELGELGCRCCFPTIHCIIAGH